VFATLMLALMPEQFVNVNVFPRAQQEAALAATVGIVHTATSGEGTAVVVKYDKAKGVAYLLTAAHVVPPGDDANRVSLEFYSPKTFPNVVLKTVGYVAYRMAEDDIAVVEAAIKDAPEIGVVRICPKSQLPTPEKLHVPVLTVGCDGPKRTPRLATDTVLNKVTVQKPNGTKVLCWETEHPPQQGRSGGPLIDKRGYLMGICSGTERNRGYYTYIVRIQQALAGAGYGWLVEGGG
jgi:S1-C subfamily serine protease